MLTLPDIVICLIAIWTMHCLSFPITFPDPLCCRTPTLLPKCRWQDSFFRRQVLKTNKQQKVAICLTIALNRVLSIWIIKRIFSLILASCNCIYTRWTIFPKIGTIARILLKVNNELPSTIRDLYLINTIPRLIHLISSRRPYSVVELGYWNICHSWFRLWSVESIMHSLHQKSVDFIYHL